MDAADDIDRQRHDVLDVAIHQSREAVAHSNDVHALEGGADRCRADDAVDAGCWSTANQDGQLLVMFHLRPPPPRAAANRSIISMSCSHHMILTNNSQVRPTCLDTEGPDASS